MCALMANDLPRGNTHTPPSPRAGGVDCTNHFWFPGTMFKTGECGNVVQFVQQSADGGMCGRRWGPINPPTNDGSCAQALLSKDGGLTFTLAYIAQNEWSGSARLPGMLGELIPPKITAPPTMPGASMTAATPQTKKDGNRKCATDVENDTFWDHTKCSSGNGTNTCCVTDWSSTTAEECCESCPGSAYGFECKAWEW